MKRPITNLAAYDGRTLLGFIVECAGGYQARLADRQVLGVYATQGEAANAISAACGRPVEEPRRG